MLFTEPAFLFFLLPLLCAVHWLLPLSGKNILLLLTGLGFYWWGEKLFMVMVVSIMMNWLFGLGVGADPARVRLRRWCLGLGIAANLTLIGIYKYADFAMDSLNAMLGWTGMAPLFDPARTRIHLPIGISFFTFQGISYLLDVYWGISKRAKSPVLVGIYISLFPHMIAGPIVKYKEIAKQFVARTFCWEDVHQGLARFVIGLGKKVIIANGLARLPDLVFAADPAHLSTGAAWFGLVCYALQLYFDFSGYSDMAIGLARMFGFRIPENFNYPFAARSVTDIWARWHMTLSTWLRDYVYFPLCGKRPTAARQSTALFIVFMICGLWHGASWNFVLWGAYNGGVLVAERGRFGAWQKTWAAPLRWIYAMLFWLLACVLFRTLDLGHAGSFLAALAGQGSGLGVADVADRHALLMLPVALLAAAPLAPWLARRRAAAIAASPACAWRWEAALSLWLAAVFTVALLLCMAGAYNPFLYFQF
jgi:alginate O-acetyltransferase complex protein AlgI